MSDTEILKEIHSELKQIKTLLLVDLMRQNPIFSREQAGLLTGSGCLKEAYFRDVPTWGNHFIGEYGRLVNFPYPEEFKSDLASEDTDQS